jgi:hypothetical protein
MMYLGDWCCKSKKYQICLRYSFDYGGLSIVRYFDIPNHERLLSTIDQKVRRYTVSQVKEYQTRLEPTIRSHKQIIQPLSEPADRLPLPTTRLPSQRLHVNSAPLS